MQFISKDGKFFSPEAGSEKYHEILTQTALYFGRIPTL